MGYRRRGFESGGVVEGKRFKEVFFHMAVLAVWWDIGEEALSAAMLWRNVYFFLIKNMIIGF